MRSSVRMALAAVVLALPIASCSSSGGNLPALATNAPTLSGYTLGPGDQLSIKVVGAEDITGDYPVTDSGTVSVPLIGDVKAAGLTRLQLEHEIAQKLAQGYIRNPKVNVAIQKYRPFYIYGEVAKPGEYPYASGMKVLNAIATAGGFTYRANQNYVIVQRHGEKAKGLGGSPIEPDDVIEVPERLF
jgi:polysaccharide export outer membrane protein